MKPTAFIIQSRHKLKSAVFQIPTKRKICFGQNKNILWAHCLGFPFFKIISIYVFLVRKKKATIKC